MGQVLHGSATTTHAVRSAIQKSDATIKELSRRYNINPKTVMKWKRRNSVEESPFHSPDRGRGSGVCRFSQALFIATR